MIRLSDRCIYKIAFYESLIRVRVKDPERLIAAHGHVIGQGLLQGDGLFPAAAGNDLNLC